MYHVSFQFAYWVDGFEPSRLTSKLYKERVSTVKRYSRVILSMSLLMRIREISNFG